MERRWHKSNCFRISLTLDTFQLLSGWLKDVVSANIQLISVTFDTFQLLSGWLKEVAPENILSIRFTLDTFTTRARAVLPRILEDLGELAAYDDPLADDLQRAAIHAQRVMDELGALELSDGKRGRPVPNRAAFDRDGASSAASPTAPPSENRRPRRRAKRDDVTGMDEL